MKRRYHAATPGLFGKGRETASTGQAVAKPLKRPAQQRAKSTVQAIYDAFVRIMRRQGWKAVTTRGVAAEAGVAVGTLYDYFPNKLAILSGYERHAVHRLLERIEHEVIADPHIGWRGRLRLLVRLTADPVPADMPYFDRQMLMLESSFAEAKHHRRVYEELLKAWHKAVAACRDLPVRPADHEVEAAFTAALGARRYVVLAGPRHFDRRRWLEDIEGMCVGLIARGSATNEDP